MPGGSPNGSREVISRRVTGNIIRFQIKADGTKPGQGACGHRKLSHDLLIVDPSILHIEASLYPDRIDRIGKQTGKYQICLRSPVQLQAGQLLIPPFKPEGNGRSGHVGVGHIQIRRFAVSGLIRILHLDVQLHPVDGALMVCGENSCGDLLAGPGVSLCAQLLLQGSSFPYRS